MGTESSFDGIETVGDLIEVLLELEAEYWERKVQEDEDKSNEENREWVEGVNALLDADPAQLRFTKSKKR